MSLSGIGSNFEMSLRILLLLNEAHDLEFDEQQICAIDFIAVYARDFGLAEENLHGYGHYRYSEYPARRIKVKSALKGLVLNGYVNMKAALPSFLYSISSNGSRICANLTNRYAEEYAIAVDTIIDVIDVMDIDQIEKWIKNRMFIMLEDVGNE